MVKIHRRVKSITSPPLKRKKPRKKNTVAVRLKTRLRYKARKKRMSRTDIKFDKLRGKHLADRRKKKSKHSLKLRDIGTAAKSGFRKVEHAIAKAGKPVRDSADRLGESIKKHSPKIGKAARKTVDIAKTGSLYAGGAAILYGAHQVTKDR